MKRTGLLSILLLLATAACTQQMVPRGEVAAVAPQLSVERFLQAANSRDLAAMSRVFGTADGPIGDTGSTLGCAFKKIGSWFGGTACVSRSDVEIRLDAIARVLEHRDYRISGEEPVAGRRHPTTRVFVDIEKGNRSISDVPFVVVRTPEGRWLVENVGLEQVMAGR